MVRKFGSDQLQSLFVGLAIKLVSSGKPRFLGPKIGRWVNIRSLVRNWSFAPSSTFENTQHNDRVSVIAQLQIIANNGPEQCLSDRRVNFDNTAVRIMSDEA